MPNFGEPSNRAIYKNHKEPVVYLSQLICGDSLFGKYITFKCFNILMDIWLGQYKRISHFI